jgi:hypothetical protein
LKFEVFGICVEFGIDRCSDGDEKHAPGEVLYAICRAVESFHEYTKVYAVIRASIYAPFENTI